MYQTQRTKMLKSNVKIIKNKFDYWWINSKKLKHLALQKQKTKSLKHSEIKFQGFFSSLSLSLSLSIYLFLSLFFLDPQCCSSDLKVFPRALVVAYPLTLIPGSNFGPGSPSDSFLPSLPPKKRWSERQRLFFLLQEIKPAWNPIHRSLYLSSESKPCLGTLSSNSCKRSLQTF